MNVIEILFSALLALAIGGLGGYFLRKSIAEAKIKSAEEAALKIIEDAKKRQKPGKKKPF